jgi:hypothetical protein
MTCQALAVTPAPGSEQCQDRRRDSASQSLSASDSARTVPEVTPGVSDSDSVTQYGILPLRLVNGQLA